MAVTPEYQAKVRACPVDVRPGGGSDQGKDVVIVDWRPILVPDTPNAEVKAYEWELGFDPTLDPPDWVDSDLRYAPAPIWAHSELYIQWLEKQLKAEPKK